MPLAFILWTDWEITERMSRECERRMLIEDFGSKHVIFISLTTQRPGPMIQQEYATGSDWHWMENEREEVARMWHWAQNLDSRCREYVEDSQTNVSHHSPPGYPWPTAQSPPLYSHVNSPLQPPSPPLPLTLLLRASAKSDKPQMGVVVCRHTCSGLLPELPFEMTTIYIRRHARNEQEENINVCNSKCV